MAILEQQHVMSRSSAAAKVQWAATYGGPFDQGNTNRLMYWYTKRKDMPLLYLVAQILLTAPAASTDNERAHSVAGRIMSKMRSSMSGDSLDRNLLGYYWLRKGAAAKAEALKDFNLENLDELEDPGEAILEGDGEVILSIWDKDYRRER